MPNDKRPSILIVDDDPEIRRLLARTLGAGYQLNLAAAGEEGLRLAEQVRPDLVLLDLRLPDLGGMAVLRGLKKSCPASAVIMMTAYGQIQTAVEAVKLGAADYLEKPFDPRRLIEQVGEIAAARGSRRPGIRERIIGDSPPMQKVWRMVEQFGPTDIPVLLLGETGTGKELFAQALHQVSRRAGGPLITVDCGTIPQELAESELFGFEEGAFTGAGKKKPGKVAWADCGTLFLDEIGVLSPACQAKLLRLVEEQGFTPLGARNGRMNRLDTRFLSATNVPLRDAAGRGTFRQDLYHRLNGVTIELPPLRERGGDLDLLAAYCLEQLRRQHHKPELELSAECAGILHCYSWPGNVRELQRVLAAAAVMAERRILPEHLPPFLRDSTRAFSAGLAGLALHLQGDASEGIDLRRIKEQAGREAEKQVILELQKRVQVSQQELARILGIDPKTLRARLRELREEEVATDERR